MTHTGDRTWSEGSDSSEDTPSVEIEALRAILQEVTESPQQQLHARLAAVDGAEWFESCLRAALGATGPELVRAGDREILFKLKRAGKRRLRSAVTPPESTEAVALYFGAVALLLAHPETESVEEVSGLTRRVLEHTIGEMRETLGEEWLPILERAEETLG